MISVTHLRAGTTFELDGQPVSVLKYEHTKMGRGTASIKVKVRNLKTWAVVEKTFISGAQVQEVATIKRKLQYLYRQGDVFYFMDPKTFEQFGLSKEVVSEQAEFLSEGATVEVLFYCETTSSAYDEKPLSVELPPKMEFTVAETGPGVKGNSATNIFKPATLENGLTVKVPLFVSTGEKILVDTRTGEYMERVK